MELRSFQREGRIYEYASCISNLVESLKIVVSNERSLCETFVNRKFVKYVEIIRLRL